MGDHDMTPTCLSAEEHEPQDPRLHYLGCLQFFEREDYINGLRDEQRKQVESELRRIAFLRDVLKKDAVDCRLVENLEDSMEKWRRGRLYTSDNGIEAVRTWRRDKSLPNGTSQRQVELGKFKDYDPDHDMNAYLTKFKNSEPVKDLASESFNGHFPNHKIPVFQLLDYKEEKNPLKRTLSISSATKPNQEGVIDLFPSSR